MWGHLRRADTKGRVDTADAEAPCPVARRASKFRGVANTNSAQTNQIESGGANLQHPLRSRGFKQLPSATFPASLALILSRHFHIRFLALGLVDNYLLSSVRFGCQLFYTLFWSSLSAFGKICPTRICTNLVQTQTHKPSSFFLKRCEV